MIKPPIARMGGKSRLRKKIIELFPEHTCYIEPFFGAGWVFFGKKPSQVEVINDIDGELMNLFYMIKHHAPEVMRLLQFEISSRDIFEQYKDSDCSKMTEVQRAVRYLYLVSQSFASRGRNFGYGTTTRPSPRIFGIDDLSLIKERLRSTYVENLDYKDVIMRYDREHSLIFCDPPYYETDGYENEFGEKEQIELAGVLRNIKGKFLLTINDHPAVREWYKGYRMIETEVMYSVAKEVSGGIPTVVQV